MVNTQSRTKKGCQIHFYFYLTRRSFPISSNSSKTVKQFGVRKCCSGVLEEISCVSYLSPHIVVWWLRLWNSLAHTEISLLEMHLSHHVFRATELWNNFFFFFVVLKRVSLFLRELLALLRLSPSSWPRNNHPAPPNSCQDVCIGAQDSFCCCCWSLLPKSYLHWWWNVFIRRSLEESMVFFPVGRREGWKYFSLKAQTKIWPQVLAFFTCVGG